MSETPQETLEHWVEVVRAPLAPPHIREAIRAVLAEAKPCTHMEGYVERLEAERDALRAEVKRQVQTGVEWAATWASNQAELASLRQRADDCCRIGEQTCAALVAERDALREKQCHHGWRGIALREAISTPCPSCGLKSLFIGTGGGLTCASLRCKSPSVEATWEAKDAERDALREKLALESELVDLHAGGATRAENEVMRLRAETADLWNKWSDAEEKRDKVEATLRAILHAEQWADVVSIIDAALCDPAPTHPRPGVPSLLAQARATLTRSLSEVVRLAEEKRGYAPTDAIGDARVEAVEEGP